MQKKTLLNKEIYLKLGYFGVKIRAKQDLINKNMKRVKY